VSNCTAVMSYVFKKLTSKLRHESSPVGEHLVLITFTVTAVQL